VIAIAHIAIKRKEQSTELFSLRCERGGQIARKIGFSPGTAQAIYSLDEHWDGKGFPHGLKGAEIPLLSRIMNVCQTLEVFAGMSGPADALAVIKERSGAWFDPDLVRACEELERDSALWELIETDDVRAQVIEMEPVGVFQFADDAKIDSVCEAFADVIDVKSPYTHAHSRGVTSVAVAIATKLGIEEKELISIRRAALFHDIGKLSVPNKILDKNGKLTSQEWETVRLHPYYTQRILERIAGFKHLAFIASTHHEKLDGSGYHRNLRATQLSMSSRAITMADIYDALSAKRPIAMPCRLRGLLRLFRRMFRMHWTNPVSKLSKELYNMKAPDRQTPRTCRQRIPTDSLAHTRRFDVALPRICRSIVFGEILQ
jgi:HD-GYP domain-containing protein (c-di-GMP phosphodiesterase class II)